MTIVFKISDNIKPSLIKYYKDYCLEKTPPYAVFQAKYQDVTITLYESGKVMFQGLSADIEASIWKELEKKHNNQKIDEKKEKKPVKKNYDDYNVIGSDECGTGDYFGPIVVTSCYVTKNDVEFLHNLKVTDSKKLTDSKIKEITPQLIKKIPYTSYILSPLEYNHNYNENINMNKIKALLHNKVLLSMVNKVDNYDYIVVDQFTPPKNYYNYLKDNKQIVKNITFMPRAEVAVLAVACASIISRYIFLMEMAKLSTELGANVPKGAGRDVDTFAKEIYQKYGQDKLQELVKLNFKNTLKIKD